eukprot:c4344_g1_i2.p1 GENE.c4344_g1_i2~~c4344_g1_i2.p1  ORF type:complete len:293 (-),score=27.50 c4344_g1_i2:102-935(-)
MNTTSASLDPFHGIYGMSLGFVFVASASIFLGNLDLAAGSGAQAAAVLLLVISSMIFIYEFMIFDAGSDHVEAVGSDPSKVLGIMTFNFAVSSTIPSLVAGRGQSVDVVDASYVSILGMGLIYAVIGMLGSMMIEGVSGNLLVTLNTDQSDIWIRFASFCFGLSCLLGMPVYSVIVRDNLTAAGIFSPTTAKIVSNGIPWVLTLIFDDQGYFDDIVNWASLLFGGAINFLIPFLVFFFARLWIQPGALQDQQTSIFDFLYFSVLFLLFSVHFRPSSL